MHERLSLSLSLLPKPSPTKPAAAAAAAWVAPGPIDSERDSRLSFLQ
jgi:hypothetical protein